MDLDEDESDGEPTLVGQKIGNYQVTAELGSGAMGDVYLGVHPEIGRKVAIKLLAVQLSVNKDMARRFMAEAKAVNTINHDNIIEVYDFGRLPSGRLYYVMEYLRGKELSAVIRNQAPLSLFETLELLKQIVSGLDAAHQAGIIHRDLKPDNIFVAQKGSGPVVKILDFGIAKLLEKDVSANQTSTGMIMGTPHYMAPEQAAGAVTLISAQSDIYSLGVITYQMLSGQLPIQAPTAAQLLARHITDPPIPLSKVTMGLPPGVCAAVERCLAKQPQDRYPSASAFFVDLERGCRGVDRNVTAQWVAVDAQGLPVPRTGVEAAAAPRGPVGFTGFGQPASTASTGGFVVQQSAYPTPVRGSGTSQCRPGTYPPQAAPGSYPPQAAPGSYPPQAYPPQAAPGSYPPQAYPPQAAPGSYPPQAYPPQAALGSYPPQVAPGTFAPAPTPQAAADTLAVAPAPAPAPATDRSATTLRQSAGEVMADEDDLDERPASWLPKLLWGLPVLLAIAAMVGWITYARKQTQSDGKETSASAPSGETEDASAPAPGMEAPRPVKVKVEARTVGVVVTVSLPGQPPAVRKVPFELEVKTGDAVVIEGSKAGFETKVESFTAAADRTVVLDLARSGGRRSPPPGGTRPPPGEPPRPRAMDPDPPRERPRIAAMDPPPRREPPRDRPRPGMGSDVGTLRPDF